MITDHVWRQPAHLAPRSSKRPGECEYMNCRRPASEHERSVSGRHQPAKNAARVEQVPA